MWEGWRGGRRHSHCHASSAKILVHTVQCIKKLLLLIVVILVVVILVVVLILTEFNALYIA